ncbi:MAG: THUMP domain-containing protein [Desulfobacterales bacterium]
MTRDAPLIKRIKRHVTGRTRDFFVATAPGLEPLCLEELKGLSATVSDAAVVPGGVEFKGRMQTCYLANLHLRTASRVLMRIGTFKASNFRQHESKMTGFPWELYLHRNETPEVKVSTRHSRLYHGTAIEERSKDCIEKRLSRYGLQPPEGSVKSCNQQVYIRVKEDRFTLSLDSSGDILHKRGIKKTRAVAPIRETIAAAVHAWCRITPGPASNDFPRRQSRQESSPGKGPGRYSG